MARKTTSKKTKKAAAAAGHGGRRGGAGRKQRPERAGFQSHLRRPELDRAIPMLITHHASASAPSFRDERVVPLIESAVRDNSSRNGFRVLHYGIHKTIFLLLVEADTQQALARGLQRLISLIARSVNPVVGRRDSLWRDRYRRRDLRTSADYRAALVEVLYDKRKPSLEYSSAIWEEGFVDVLLAKMRARRGDQASPVAQPQTAIASKGWLKAGKLEATEEQP